MRWDDQEDGVVICETIHRAKGLERLAVIVVDVDAEASKELEYVGSSRAILHLTVITAS